MVETEPGVYAPLGGGCPAAKQVKELLEAYAANERSDPWWAQRFWMGVAQFEGAGSMGAELRKLLQAHGYIGAQTLTIPRTAELKKQLDSLAAGCQAPLGSGGAWPMQATALGTQEEARWGNALPADFQRAGAEIDRSIRADGLHERARLAAPTV